MFSITENLYVEDGLKNIYWIIFSFFKWKFHIFNIKWSSELQET